MSVVGHFLFSPSSAFSPSAVAVQFSRGFAEHPPRKAVRRRRRRGFSRFARCPSREESGGLPFQDFPEFSWRTAGAFVTLPYDRREAGSQLSGRRLRIVSPVILFSIRLDQRKPYFCVNAIDLTKKPR